MELVSSYSRRQAIADGFLIDVTSTAAEAGFKLPVAVTDGLWSMCVAWSDDDTRRRGIPQDEAGRLWDVLWMASLAARGAARRNAPTNRVDFQVLTISRHTSGRRPLPVDLWMHIGPGDRGEPVITIMLQGED